MKRLLSLLLLLLPTVALSADRINIGLNDVIRTLENPFKADAPMSEAISDFSADFFQESHLASLDQSQRGRGQVSVKFAPGNAGRVPRTYFRWLYQVPNEQEIVSDGSTLWVYQPENRQVIQSDISAISRANSGDPMTFLTGLGNLSRDFVIGFAMPNQDAAGNYVLDLRPRKTSSLIRQLFIVVDRDAVFARQRGQADPDLFPMLSTTVIDPSDNKTIIEFSNIRVNRGLTEFEFRFIMPPGVEVIRPTGAEMGF